MDHAERLATEFRDRVIRYALTNVAGPHFERLLHPRSDANRVGQNIAAGKYESPPPP